MDTFHSTAVTSKVSIPFVGAGLTNRTLSMFDRKGKRDRRPPPLITLSLRRRPLIRNAARVRAVTTTCPLTTLRGAPLPTTCYTPWLALCPLHDNPVPLHTAAAPGFKLLQGRYYGGARKRAPLLCSAALHS